MSKIGKGVQATEAAKAAVAKIENAVRREVITPDKLVRTPASDLYDKSCYMSTERFWKDNAKAVETLEFADSLNYGQIKKLPRSTFGQKLDKIEAKLAETFEPVREYVNKMRKLAKYKENNL